MNYEQTLKNVTVLGAAGKMGSGILLLTAVEMADLALKNKSQDYVLYAMDVSVEGLSGLMKYVRTQVQKVAEKKIVQLRGLYADRADLIENGEIIDQYVFDVMNVIRPVTRIEPAYDSYLIFEAIKEDPDLKVRILSQINKNNPNKPWFFTNTSSIPITNLDEKAELGGRIIGFHFYNPPAVQKLVELIKSKQTFKEVEDFALNYAKKLKKVIVPSNDFAGFIGNGHFMRDALHGISEVQKLTKEFSYPEAVYIINKISQEYLIRPMGIFQLIDYVGVDVVQYIMSVMNPYLKDEDLHSDLLDKMITLGVKGGQYSDGSQKDGMLKYEKGKVTGIYNPETKSYEMIAGFQEKCDEKLGALPASTLPWKALVGSKTKDEILTKYYADLKAMNTLGAKLALDYAKRSKEIGQLLVNSKVALNENDVNTVLLTGFFHAYGPINNYI